MQWGLLFPKAKVPSSVFWQLRARKVFLLVAIYGMSLGFVTHLSKSETSLLFGRWWCIRSHYSRGEGKDGEKRAWRSNTARDSPILYYKYCSIRIVSMSPLSEWGFIYFTSWTSIGDSRTPPPPKSRHRPAKTQPPPSPSHVLWYTHQPSLSFPLQSDSYPLLPLPLAYLGMLPRRRQPKSFFRRWAE